MSPYITIIIIAVLAIILFFLLRKRKPKTAAPTEGTLDESAAEEETPTEGKPEA